MCPDAVKPDVPVVMDFGYLTRSVLADIVLSNLIDLLNMFIASLPKSSLVLFLFRVSHTLNLHLQTARCTKI